MIFETGKTNARIRALSDAVGSGVIGDISKILASVSAREYMIVAAAPSMDGYASSTSSMTRSGLKVSLPSTCARSGSPTRG